ncbi:hypothetical protein TPB0596_20870 [Tsukamurella pulmonis]|uniref:hypothetical protein n=1 Tax=Tsukamurella pulmonis TaxID=47312 RepID=UPI001EDE01A6|nr:hypothetical protein [Tsukamurella pulmonis]BDD82324.1 hypothetical protein TPB0596_20870 [Tsukamurella pulmonis]
MPDPSDDTTPITPPNDPADDVTTTVMPTKGTRPQHAVTSDAPGIGRGGWWAITIAAAAWLIAGFLLAFGPARYWTPVPAVFLGYFLISGVIGLVFWKGVRELQNSDPNLRTDDPAPTGQRVAAAIGAVGIATAVILLPAGLSSTPANALPCPDGSNTCGPTAPTFDPGPTQGGNTTAPQAPNTTIPPNVDTGLPQAPTQGNGGFQGTVQQMPTPDNVDPNSCIFNCGPTQAPQAPQTGQANPPQTGQQQPPQTGQQQPPQTGQNPVTTAPQTVATTPQAPTSTPKLRTPRPETTTSSKQRDNDEDQQRSSNEDRDKNSGIPYQAAELGAIAGTYRRRKKEVDTAVEGGRAVAGKTTQFLREPVDGDEITVQKVSGPKHPKVGGSQIPGVLRPSLWGDQVGAYQADKPGQITTAITDGSTPPQTIMFSEPYTGNATKLTNGSFKMPVGPVANAMNPNTVEFGIDDWVVLRAVGVKQVATSVTAGEKPGVTYPTVTWEYIYEMQHITIGTAFAIPMEKDGPFNPVTYEQVAALATKTGVNALGQSVSVAQSTPGW